MSAFLTKTFSVVLDGSCGTVFHAVAVVEVETGLALCAKIPTEAVLTVRWATLCTQQQQQGTKLASYTLGINYITHGMKSRAGCITKKTSWGKSNARNITGASLNGV